jgi:hypothetical protein
MPPGFINLTGEKYFDIKLLNEHSVNNKMIKRCPDAIPFIAHGLANLGGTFAPWTKSLLGFADAAWLFSGGVTLGGVTGHFSSLVWLASSACLAVAGAGLLARQPWWLTLAVLGCACSLAAIVPWWRGVPPGAKFGAIFDLAVIALLLSPLGARIVQAVR